MALTLALLSIKPKITTRTFFFYNSESDLARVKLFCTPALSFRRKNKSIRVDKVCKNAPIFTPSVHLTAKIMIIMSLKEQLSTMRDLCTQVYLMRCPGQCKMTVSPPLPPPFSSRSPLPLQGWRYPRKLAVTRGLTRATTHSTRVWKIPPAATPAWRSDWLPAPPHPQPKIKNTV